MSISIDEHTQALADYLPTGKVWLAKHKSTSNTRLLLRGLAVELQRMDMAIDQYLIEVMPDTTTQMLDEWELTLGLPDDCFLASSDPEIRRRNITIKLASLGIQTAQDFVDLADLFGFTVEVNSGVEHQLYATKLPALSIGTPKVQRNTIVVVEEIDEEQFTYDFPFTFPQAGDLQTMECLMTKAKPAVCDILFVEAP